MSQYLTVRVPTALRDTDGVRLDAMLVGIGAMILRELPRTSTEHVDLVVEDTSAPAHLRGRVVTPVYDEIAGQLSFDRWELLSGRREELQPSLSSAPVGLAGHPDLPEGMSGALSIEALEQLLVQLKTQQAAAELAAEETTAEETAPA